MSKEGKSTAPTPGSKGRKLSPVLFLGGLPIVAVVASAAIVHLHQFSYLFNLLPNLLEYFVLRENIPLAFIGIQFLITVKFTGILMAIGRASLTKEGYNNNLPREHDSNHTGLMGRIQGVHKNSHEAYPTFAAAILCAHIAQVPIEKLIYFATLHTFSRIAYIAFYLADLASLRSIAFIISNYTNVYLFLFATVNNFDSHFQELCKLLYATPF